MAQRKSIFITGGASGIGQAIALKFGKEGWFVGLADIDEAGMAATQALLANGYNYAHKLDVRDHEAWDTALQSFERAAGGRIDVVANNAGIPLGGSLSENSIGEIDRCLDINLRGAFYGARASLPFLRKTAPGSCLLTTCSAAGLYGSPGASVYSATKFGVRALTESLDAELAGEGIKARSIMPSFIDTPLLDHNANAKENQPIRQRVSDAGLEITPVADVAEAAWEAVHGDRIHTIVGKTARRIAFASRWMPGRLRKKMQRREGSLGR